MTYPYRYGCGPRFRVPGLPVLDRKGALCRVLVRGAMNSALIEFEDGEWAIVSRNALRRTVTGGARTRQRRDVVTRIPSSRDGSNKTQ
jgi:hypothetical protein